MEKVGNIEGSAKTEPPYPAVYINQWQEDEIDLVELWIVMWSYRRLFLASAIFIFVIGILCFELFYLEKPTSTVRSIIEIESVLSGQKQILVIDPDVLINRIKHSKLPRFSSLAEFEQIKPSIMTTTASPIKQGSNMVEIVTSASTGDIADVSRFHEQLVDEIQLDLKKSAVMVTAGVNDTLYSLKSRIVQLRRQAINLEGDLMKEVNREVASNKSVLDSMASKKANLESEIDTLTERIENMELIRPNPESLILLKAEVSVNPPTVRSMIEIESVLSGQKQILVIDPDVLINRIKHSKLPRFSSLAEFEQIKSLIMTTNASPIKQGSNIVEIVTRASTGDIADVSRFHEQLVDEIQLDLKKSAVMVTAGVNDTLYSLKSRIVQLSRHVMNLEEELIKSANSQVASNKPVIDIITSKKANLESEIDTLTERIENMELIQSNAGSLVLQRAEVAVNPPKFPKLFAYPMILILSLLIALFATKGVVFSRKVRERMAAEG